MQKIDYRWLVDRGLILYEVISGSRAYGTNLPTSDEDRRYVYILPIEYILSGNYPEQVNDNKNDVVGYEIGRFLNLLESSNPNIIELLNIPTDCIIHKTPIFDIVLENRDKFITKRCKNSFAGYAHSQILKARGQNKKQNWEKNRVERKDILDFVYVISGSKTIPWREWSGDLYQEDFCGVVNLPNARDVYALYYDESSSLGYRGLVKSGESESNQLRLSSIPVGQIPICNVIYNKDAYTQHCKEFKSYRDWLDNRNLARWVDVESHGQKIDGKNLLHLVRLIRMSREIGLGQGVIVRRPDFAELLDIRSGKFNLEKIIESADSELKEIDRIYELSDLPEGIENGLVDELVINIRKKFYGI